jgi:hypothetical protein
VVNGEEDDDQEEGREEDAEEEAEPQDRARLVLLPVPVGGPVRPLLLALRSVRIVFAIAGDASQSVRSPIGGQAPGRRAPGQAGQRRDGLLVAAAAERRERRGGEDRLLDREMTVLLEQP